MVDPPRPRGCGGGFWAGCSGRTSKGVGMQRFEFTLTGVTPLLMHADSIIWADKMTEWKNKAKEAKSDRKSVV